MKNIKDVMELLQLHEMGIQELENIYRDIFVLTTVLEQRATDLKYSKLTLLLLSFDLVLLTFFNLMFLYNKYYFVVMMNIFNIGYLVN